MEAALIARATGRPVKLIWTREEDIGYGMFRPQTFQCVEAALDADGRLSGWRRCVVGDGVIEISLERESGRIRVHEV